MDILQLFHQFEADRIKPMLESKEIRSPLESRDFFLLEAFVRWAHEKEEKEKEKGYRCLYCGQTHTN